MPTSDSYAILIVDDIENNRFTLDLMLSVLGEFSIDEAESGPEALEMIASKSYDLVLLDVMMPGMTGIDVLKALDLPEQQDPLNVIVVSALQDIDTIAKALELGALDYLPKPIEEALLAARIRQLLDRHQTDLLLKQHRQRIDSDLKKAAEIQLSLCPKNPYSYETLQGLQFEINGIMRPAYEVGGDFFDYFELPGGDIALVVADACGKGAPAAIYATRVHDLLRVLSNNNSDNITPADNQRRLTHLLTETNQILSNDNEDCWFVTAWVGIYSHSQSQLTWYSAGHCEALVEHRDGTIDKLVAEVGLPLGLDDRLSAPIHSTEISSGDTLYLYTDGITEHRDENGKFLGVEGFTEILNTSFARQESLSARIKNIADTVESVNQECKPTDDVTLMSMRITANEKREL